MDVNLAVVKLKGIKRWHFKRIRCTHGQEDFDANVQHGNGRQTWLLVHKSLKRDGPNVLQGI